MTASSEAYLCPYWPPEQRDNLACVHCPIAPLPCLFDRPVGRPISYGGLVARQLACQPMKVVCQQTGLSERQVWRIRRGAATIH